MFHAIDRTIDHRTGRRTRRAWGAIVSALAAGLAIALAGGCRNAGADATTVQVWKTPTCGCCSKWIDHLKAEGFAVEAQDLADLAATKAANGVPAELASCHTATVDGYVLEGHVPASDIRRLLGERPAIAGLAVPGMPLGSPGMEHPDPSSHEAYQVMSFGAGGVAVYSSHDPG